jgi:hypothetical protein
VLFLRILQASVSQGGNIRAASTTHRPSQSGIYQEKPDDRLWGDRRGNPGFTLIATALAPGESQAAATAIPDMSWPGLEPDLNRTWPGLGPDLRRAAIDALSGTSLYGRTIPTFE